MSYDVNSTPKSQVEAVSLRVGDMAPDFTLPTHSEGDLNLSWYRGRKNVAIAFYPGDWTPVCAIQIPDLQRIAARIEALDTQLLAVSVDSIPCHIAWARSLGGLSFPLMSDYYPHGRVARLYGILTERGYAGRALFLIDKTGVIRYRDQVKPAEVPDHEKLLEAIRALPRD